MPLKVLVAEDVPDTLLDITNLLNAHPELEVVAAFEDASLTTDYLATTSPLPDALFLDIRLMDGTAFDILRNLKELKITIPPVVLITAEAEHDFIGQITNHFKEDVVYYIAKAFRTTWKRENNLCVNKIKERLEVLSAMETPQGPLRKRLAVPVGDKTTLVPVEDIIYFEKSNKIIYIHVKDYDEPFRDTSDSHGLSYYHKELGKRPDFVYGSRQLLINSSFVQDVSNDYKTGYLTYPTDATLKFSKDGGERVRKAAEFGGDSR